MKSLKEYFLYEDEDKFVPISYSTTKEDDVQLADPVYKGFADDEDDDNDRETGGKFDANLRLVAELHLYSEESTLFSDRKRKIVEVFKKMLKESEYVATRIQKTKIFEYYISHLITYYKKNVNENINVNLATRDELSRQIAADFVMILRDREIFPSDIKG